MKTAIFAGLLSIFCVAVVPASELPKVVRPGSTEPVPFPGAMTHVLAGANDTPASTAVLELAMPPRSFGAPPHIHSLEDEYFYVLEGSVDFLDREETISATKGSLVILPRGHLHGFWNASEEPAKLLLIITPGDFGSFFDEVVAEIRKTNAENPDQIAALIAAAAAERGVRIMPEKIPEAAKPLLGP